jgi:hypothetical protein
VHRFTGGDRSPIDFGEIKGLAVDEMRFDLEQPIRPQLAAAFDPADVQFLAR